MNLSKSFKFGKLAAFAMGLALMLGFASCTTPKNITYFQDAYPGSEIEMVTAQPVIIKPGDKLSIYVHSFDSRLSQLFNLNSGVNSGGNRTEASTYTVNSRGNIDFPVLGEVPVAGLTRQKVAETIKEELIARDLVKDPVVTVNFSSMHVILLGSTGGKSVPIDKDQFTILDAISAAGDLKITGMRENVKVLRQEGNKQKVYTVNLLSAQDLYSSPVYYLQQNDVVYVEPSDKEKRTATNDGNQFYTFSFWLSMATMALSICAIIW